jgi:23S rRNA pseudouridine1911/1915/1917 synthase
MPGRVDSHRPATGPTGSGSSPGPGPSPGSSDDDDDTTHTITVRPEAAGERLDKVLAGAVADLSRSRVQTLLGQGRVRSAGQTITDPSRRVKSGQVFEVAIPPPEPPAPEPQAMDLVIVYEDDDLLVIDKPAGLVVHPAPGNPDATLVNALLAHCGASLSGIGGVRRPGIVHRLDKDTSGLIVVAKNDRAHHALTAQFADRSLSRTYHAVVRGVPSPTRGRIAGNIGRCPSDRKKMALLASGGRPAATGYRVLTAFGTAAALVECTLETGRTHQIRVHMASIGHPVAGDPLYGRGGRQPARHPALAAFPRQALHAVAIVFIHPASGLPMRFDSPLPADIHALILALEAQ